MPALCSQCQRVVWGERPHCPACDVLLLPRPATLVRAELETADTLESLIDRALLACELDDHAGAVVELRDVLERWPASGRAQLSLGLALAGTHDLLAAVRCVSRATRLDPARVAPPRTSAELMACQTAAARRELLESEGLTADNGFELGQYRAMAGDFPGALDAYTRALRAHREDPELLTAIGVALRLLGKPEEAIDLHQRALSHRPDFALAYNNLASAWADVGDVVEARAAASRALELQPTLGHANISLAYALLHDGESAAALSALADAERRTPSLRPHAAVLSAVALLLRNLPHDALLEAEDGLEHRLAHHVPHLHLARAAAFEALGRPQEAMVAQEPLWFMATAPDAEPESEPH